MPVARFLLCRLRTGLNDVLCQIEKCLQYCEKYNRILIIDGKHSGFRGPFSRYFVQHQGYNDFIEWNKDLVLPNDSCFPNVLEGQISNYIAKYCPVRKNFFEIKSDIQLTFDFSQDYKETLLVNDQCGGGVLSIDCLKRFTFTPGIKEIVKNGISHLTSPYLSVHIRNTDYQTDYLTFFESIKAELSGKNVLICSDDAVCIAKARSFFDNSRVMIATDVPDLKGVTLHAHNNLDPHEVSIGFLTDLIALAKGEKVYITNCRSGIMSGYSMLAYNLNKNPDILDGLLN
jgi:hypothetical protein